MVLDLGSCVCRRKFLEASELIVGEVSGLTVSVGESGEVDDGNNAIGESSEVPSRDGDGSSDKDVEWPDGLLVLSLSSSTSFGWIS